MFALHLLIWALGLAARALDSGRSRVSAALVLALTSLSHIVFGHVAFASAAVVALVGPEGERSRRLVRFATIVSPGPLLLLWFLVPLAAARDEVNADLLYPVLLPFREGTSSADRFMRRSSRWIITSVSSPRV